MDLNLKRNITIRIANSKFECKRCGLCCKTADIMLSNREINGISYHLKIDREEFIKKFTKIKEINKIKHFGDKDYYITGKCYVIKKDENNVCPFFREENKLSYCTIYEYRPIVCRLFPYIWEYNYEENAITIDYSNNGWNECPGIIKNTKSNWDKIRDEVTAAVILSIIQTNELELEGSISQKLLKK